MPPARTATKPSRGAKPAPKSKPKAAPKVRARRSAPVWRPRAPVFEQRHLDLAGLALVAAGVFLAFPLSLRGDGGAAGEALIGGMRTLVGQVAYAAPVAVMAAGALLVLRPVLPALRPFRSGALC